MSELIIVCVRFYLILVCFGYITLLVQIPVHRRYTGNTVRLDGYEYGSYWLTYVHCSHYKCIVTQNA